MRYTHENSIADTFSRLLNLSDKPLLHIALSFYGLKEVAGAEHNPIILRMFSTIGSSWVKDDETAWCSAFISYCAKIAGLEYSKKLNARSWLEIGKELLSPLLGDLVIFWRGSPDGWKGHVGIFIANNDNNIYVLGGNQNNSVCIKPYSLERVLGYRRLRAQHD